VKVRIATPLRSYTDQQAVVEADGGTLVELLADLERNHPGIRFRIVDEQGRLRQHVKIFVGEDSVRDLDVPLAGVDEVTIMQALSGG
jgi:molybdopterin converting factor small subunit